MKTSRINIVILLLTVLIATSCSNNKESKAKELLSTVPANSGMVALIDMEKIADAMGSPEMLLDQLSVNGKKESVENVKELLKFVDIDYAVAFADGYNCYVTATLSDPDAFVKQVNKISEDKLIEKEGLQCSRKLVINGSQMWLKISHGAIDVTTIKGYSDLSEMRSFASCDYVDELIDDDKDVSFIGDISSLMNLSDSNLKNLAMSQMVLSTLFKDAAYLAGDVELKKGEGEINIEVLDFKYGHAPYLLPSKPIDVSTIKNMTGTANNIIAVSLPAEMVSKILDVFGSFGGSVNTMISDAVRPIDGTIVCAIGKNDSALKGIITTNGSGDIAITAALEKQDFNVSKNGKLITIERGGTVDGPFEIGEQADLFKGCLLGYVGAVPVEDNIKGLDKVSFGVYIDKGSLRLKVVIFGKDKSENILKLLKRESNVAV